MLCRLAIHERKYNPALLISYMILSAYNHRPSTASMGLLNGQRCQAYTDPHLADEVLYIRAVAQELHSKFDDPSILGPALAFILKRDKPHYEIHLITQDIHSMTTSGVGLPLNNALAIDVAEQHRVYADLEWVPKFQLYHCTDEYKAFLQQMPPLFIGTEVALQQAIKDLCSRMEQSLAAFQMPLPPWRTASKLLASYHSLAGTAPNIRMTPRADAEALGKFAATAKGGSAKAMLEPLVKASKNEQTWNSEGPKKSPTDDPQRWLIERPLVGGPIVLNAPSCRGGECTTHECSLDEEICLGKTELIAATHMNDAQAVMVVPYPDGPAGTQHTRRASDCYVAELPLEILDALPGRPEILRSASTESLDFEKDMSYQASSSPTSPAVSQGSYLSQMMLASHASPPERQESVPSPRQRRALYVSTSYPPVSIYH